MTLLSLFFSPVCLTSSGPYGLRGSFLGFLTFFCANFLQAQPGPAYEVVSPDEHISVAFRLNPQAQPTYTIRYDSTLVMPSAVLGVTRTDGDFVSGLRLLSVSPPKPVTDTYRMIHGKRQQLAYQASKLVVHLTNGAGQKIDIQFQVSNDGVAFRYHFPEQSADLKTIQSEATSFQFKAGTVGWLQPCAEPKSGWNASHPSYEEQYWQQIPLAELPVSAADWVYPALFQSGTYWILLSETAPDRNYCGTRLRQIGSSNTFTTALADPREVFTGGVALPTARLPWTTPWRLITVGNQLSTIVESTLGTDLAHPTIAGDFSFVKPGRAAWSWGRYGDDSTTFEGQKSFIDYAARMGWEYNLIDAEWDKRIGDERMAKLAVYASMKRVGLLLWYNSAGDWNTVPQTPKSKLLTTADRHREFARLKAWGIKGIKVDFFGGDGQSMMTYYQDLIEDAAKYGLLVNCHGATLPRGWQRTYPNLVTVEAVRGYEAVGVGGADAYLQPTHCSLLPFTRNVFDPMDYTTTVFSDGPDNNRVTTNAFQLALPFLFLSGIQHFVEVPNGMANVPSYVRQLLTDVPVAWEETRFVAGFPGRWIVIARRSGHTWYVSGINGEATDKAISLKLPFILAKSGILITDGDTNRSFARSDVMKDADGNLTLSLKANGGFVLMCQE